MTGSRLMIIIVRSWSKIRIKRVRNKVSEQSYSRQDFKLQKKMLKNTTRLKLMPKHRETQRNNSSHLWILRDSNLHHKMRVIQHLHIRLANTLIQSSLTHHNTMTSSMTYLQTKDTRPTLDALVKKKEQILFKINSVIGATTLKLNSRRKFTRPISDKTKNLEPLLSKEGLRERG